jgi:hypothetical protein
VELPYYRAGNEQLYPFLVDELVLDVDPEKVLLEQKFYDEAGWQSFQDQLLSLLPNTSVVLNRQIPW